MLLLKPTDPPRVNKSPFSPPHGRHTYPHHCLMWMGRRRRREEAVYCCCRVAFLLGISPGHTKQASHCGLPCGEEEGREIKLGNALWFKNETRISGFLVKIGLHYLKYRLENGFICLYRRVLKEPYNLEQFFL